MRAPPYRTHCHGDAGRGSRTPPGRVAAMAMFPGGYGIRPYGVGVDARHRPGKFSAAAKPSGHRGRRPLQRKKPSPCGGRWPSEARSDEGRPCLHNPCMGIAAKPPLIRPLATFSLGGRLFYFHILIIPNALATELARMTAAKIGQSQRIMKRNTFLRRKG